MAVLALLPRRAVGVGSVRLQRGSMIAGIGALLRVPAFHILFWSFLICGFTTTGVIETHLLPYASFCGFPPLPSETAYGVLSAVNLGGMALAGYLSDRVHRPTLLGSIYLVRAASFVLLLYIAPDIRLLYVFVVLFGLVDYSTVPVTVGLAASHLGIERIGLAMGLISGGHAFGGALGALAGGCCSKPPALTAGFGWHHLRFRLSPACWSSVSATSLSKLRETLGSMRRRQELPIDSSLHRLRIVSRLAEDS